MIEHDNIGLDPILNSKDENIRSTLKDRLYQKDSEDELKTDVSLTRIQ